MLTKVALIQPVTAAGKSLGIFKSPESIQALAGQLQKLGYQVKMFHSADSDELRWQIHGFLPHFICISTMTANFPEGHKIAQAIKNSKYFRRVKIILGGWHASGCVKAYESGQEKESLREILNRDSPFDYVVAGEGEEVLPKLIEAIKNNFGIMHLKGVSYFSGGEIQLGGSTPRINNLDGVAMPSWEGLEVNQYRDKRNGALDLSVHFNRGCRFKCAYCATASVYGRGIRTTPAEQAFEYIEFLAQKFKPQVITFTDEDFFANLPWVRQLVNLLQKENFHHKYGISFDTFASVNDLHRLQRNGHSQLLHQMKATGFNSFTIGIESFSVPTLKKYNKELMILPTMLLEQKIFYNEAKSFTKRLMLHNHYLSTVQQAINFAHEHGFLVVGDYILGNPDESVDAVLFGFRSFKSLCHLMLAYLPVYTPFPGTALWLEAYTSGQLARKDDGKINWGKFDASGSALDLGYDIASLRNNLEIEFYTSDRYAEDMLAMIEKNPAIKKFFLDRLKYLDQTYPDDPRIIKQLAHLQ
ncbi:MAG: radical SAM protein [Parcubacteria group bacterium]